MTAPFNEAGKAAADWMIKDSGGKANVLIVGGSDILPSPGTIKTMQDEFAANCPDCSTTVTNIPVADWNTKTQGVVQSALQANPKVSFMIIDPANPYKYVELRGDAEISADDDYSFANQLGAKYGADLRDRDKPGEARVAVTIKPARIVTWG